MKKIKLLLGNFTFNNFSDEELKLFSVGVDHVESADKPLCLIHELNGVLECESMEQAYELGEEFCNMFGSYLIPEDFKGEIAYEPNATQNIKELFGNLK